MKAQKKTRNNTQSGSYNAPYPNTVGSIGNENSGSISSNQDSKVSM